MKLSEFDHGVLWAVCRIVELHDEPVVAADVLRESGINITTRQADIADRPFLKTILDEPYFRNLKEQIQKDEV